VSKIQEMGISGGVLVIGDAFGGISASYGGAAVFRSAESATLRRDV